MKKREDHKVVLTKQDLADLKHTPRLVSATLLRARVLLLLKRLVAHERNLEEREKWIKRQKEL